MKIVVANGPNLNLLGTREPEIYGRMSLADIEAMVAARAAELGCEVAFFQTNHEGELIDWIQAEAPGSGGVVLNGGALTHYSYSLYDCLRSLAVPVVEVHLSNLHSRSEAFRVHSVTAPATVGVITGLGVKGYLFAMEYLVDRDQ
ncbi:MAG TPA: type II 3-dehydroquinate dehydratase [Candidatus Dormibacteraeota bacterium]|jgi:3-dehydroquinate dehydratase-2|nr:type II 3-dehydroquinate dehydratase [Candidatus Dormibacteraeota bacterium]